VWVGESPFWYRPTRVVPDQRPLNGRCCCCCCWLYRWLNRLAHAFDAPAQKFTVRPTSHAQFLDVNCDQLTDMHMRLLATFNLWSQMASDHSVCGVSRSLVCVSVSWTQFSSRNQLACYVGLTKCGSVSKQCTNLYISAAHAQTMASSRCRSIVSKQQTNGMLLPLSINKTDERSDAL